MVHQKLPLLHSPMKVWREEAGISQETLSHLTKLSITTIIWNELLLYSEPSPKIISVFQHGSKEIELSDGRWLEPTSPVGPLGSYQYYTDEYKEAQNLYRDKFDFNAANETASTYQATLKELQNRVHPFVRWRMNLGFHERVTFCRAACVSPPQVLNYEQARQRTMPKNVSGALEGRFKELERLQYYGSQYYGMVSY